MGMTASGVGRLLSGGLVVLVLAGGTAPTVGAKADICVSNKGETRVDKGSSTCQSDETSHAMAKDGSEALARHDSHAQAKDQSEARAADDSHAQAKDHCVAEATGGETERCP